ncbi:MAG: YihY/virulence factor BrkB family protein [Betaproteobacteria bacterium]
MRATELNGITSVARVPRMQGRAISPVEPGQGIGCAGQLFPATDPRSGLPPRQHDRDSERPSLPETSRGWRWYTDLVKEAGHAWVADRAPTMGAALAFYSAFALAPLLILVIALASYLYGSDVARGAIVQQLNTLVGAPAAAAVQALLQGAESRAGVVATTLGVLTMLIGATTILVELQDDLDAIWKAPKRGGSSLVTIVRARIVSLLIFLAIAFLLFLSLVFSVVMAAFAIYAESHLPSGTAVLIRLSNEIFSAGAITILFAMLFKGLPNVSIAWRDVWLGAFVTAVLFSVGRLGIGLYLGRSAIATTYGAAGTLVVLLLWLYYSAQVFLIGAEITCTYARHRTAKQSISLMSRLHV